MSNFVEVEKKEGFKIYICINPNCDSYLDEVERPSEAENPICNDCGEKLEEEY